MKYWLVSAACVLAASPASLAHHSISGVYDTAQPITVEGTIAQYQHVNPHPYIIVEVRRGGTVEKWFFELDNRRELTDIGITETTFKPGDHIIVVGSPARLEPRKLYVERLDRPADGFGFEQVRNSPRLRSRPR
jgi:hypothetical protein